MLKLSLKMTLRDWRAGELRFLLLALVVSVTALSSVNFFTDRLAVSLKRNAYQMLGADLVGFHTPAYLRHFATSLVDILGHSLEIDRVQLPGREVRLGVFPMGIDAAAFRALARDPAVEGEVEAIRGDGSVRILVGVDRLDYTKGIPRRLMAYEQMLRTHPELRERVRMGEGELINVRSRDGGWNYGSPAALGVDLPSYPETTALALVGLQGQSGLGSAFDVAARQLQETPSPLARAWLTIALRLDGATPPEPAGDLTGDLMITAVEALAAADGNYALMRTEGQHVR